MSEPFSLSGILKIAGGSSLLLIMADVAAQHPEIVEKVANPTPWEAIIAALVTLGSTLGTLVIRSYAAPEKKMDAQHAALAAKLDKFSEDSAKADKESGEWREKTSRELGAIGATIGAHAEDIKNLKSVTATWPQKAS